MGSVTTLYHQAGLLETQHDIEGAIRCMEQVIIIDKKYNLPKLAENEARLARLRKAF